MTVGAVADVIVVGLGGMGSCAAAHLARRGARVLGLERFGPAHDRGSSHGLSRVIRQAYFEDPAYVPLLWRTYELFEEAEKETGAELLTITGGLFLGTESSSTFGGSLAAAREWDLPHEVLTATEVRARFPTLQPWDEHLGLYEPRAGVVRPEATVRTHLDLAAAAGADLRFGVAVESWSATDRGVTVRTADGTVHRGGHLVIAPGAWAPRLLADLVERHGVAMRVERLVQHWLAPVGGTGPFVGHPVWIAELDGGEQVYGFPALPGASPTGGSVEGVKVAFFRRWTEADPDHLDRTVTAEEVAAIRARVGTVVPSLAEGAHVDSRPCMYTTTPDEHFVIAPHPDHPAVTVACGFSGHGFKFAPVVGEILADLAIDGATGHPIELFHPRRLAA